MSDWLPIVWEDGSRNPGSTQEYWDFTPNYVGVSLNGYTADPEIDNNPLPNRVNATILGGTYDGIGRFSGPAISVSLEIPNYEGGLVKYIWVDLGYSGTLLGPSVSAVNSAGGTTLDMPCFRDRVMRTSVSKSRRIRILKDQLCSDRGVARPCWITFTLTLFVFLSR